MMIRRKKETTIFISVLVVYIISWIGTIHIASRREHVIMKDYNNDEIMMHGISKTEFIHQKQLRAQSLSLHNSAPVGEETSIHFHNQNKNHNHVITTKTSKSNQSLQHPSTTRGLISQLNDKINHHSQLTTTTTLTATETSNHTGKITQMNNSFCVSWGVNTDDWWTHNPEWSISFENDTHYCFQHMSQKKANLFQSIYQTQFNGNCSNAVIKSMWNSGWGADLSNVCDGLRYGHQINQTFMVRTSSIGWHYAAKKDGSKPVCEHRDMQCYFLNYTNCRYQHNRQDNNRGGGSTGTSNRESFLLGSWQGFHKSRDYLEYLIRPQTWLRRKVYEFSRPYLDQLTKEDGSCTVLHVRRGDVVLRDPTPRRYHEIEEYMNATNVTKTVLLLTDDHNAIGEALYKFPSHNWVYINRTRYKGT